MLPWQPITACILNNSNSSSSTWILTSHSCINIISNCQTQPLLLTAVVNSTLNQGWFQALIIYSRIPKKIFQARWIISRWWWCLLQHSHWALRTSQSMALALSTSHSPLAAWSRAIATARWWLQLLTTHKWALTRMIPRSRSIDKGPAVQLPLTPPLESVSPKTKWSMESLLHSRWWWMRIWPMTTPTPLCCNHLFRQGRWGDSCLGGRLPKATTTSMMCLISYHRQLFQLISKSKGLINFGRKRLSCLFTSESLELTRQTLMILRWWQSMLKNAAEKCCAQRRCSPPSMDLWALNRLISMRKWGPFLSTGSSRSIINSNWCLRHSSWQ